MKISREHLTVTPSMLAGDLERAKTRGFVKIVSISKWSGLDTIAKYKGQGNKIHLLRLWENAIGKEFTPGTYIVAARADRRP